MENVDTGQIQEVVPNFDVMDLLRWIMPAENNNSNGDNKDESTPNVANACPSTNVSPALTIPIDLETTTFPLNQLGEYMCLICGFTAPRKSHYISHMNTHGEFHCVMCDFNCRSETRLKNHINTCHSIDEKVRAGLMAAGADTGGNMRTRKKNPRAGATVYKCLECDHHSFSRDEKWTHSRIHIPVHRQLNCDMCNYVTVKKSHWEGHIRIHTGHKPFECTKCHYKCVRQDMLTSHMKSHGSDYQYRNVDCGYASEFGSSLKGHVKRSGHQGHLDDREMNNPSRSHDSMTLGEFVKMNMKKESETLNAAAAINNFKFNLPPLADPAPEPIQDATCIKDTNTDVESTVLVSATSPNPPLTFSIDQTLLASIAQGLLNCGIIGCEHCGAFYNNQDVYVAHMLNHQFGNP